MTTKRARLRNSKNVMGITRAKTHNTRAKRKAATAKRMVLASGLAATAKKAASAVKAPAAVKVAGKAAGKKLPG